MPKIFLTQCDKSSDELVKLIYGTMKVLRITQAHMAKKLDISQQAFSKKLKNAQFTYWELVIVFDELGFSDKQIVSLMKKEK